MVHGQTATQINGSAHKDWVVHLTQVLLPLDSHPLEAHSARALTNFCLQPCRRCSAGGASICCRPWRGQPLARVPWHRMTVPSACRRAASTFGGKSMSTAAASIANACAFSRRRQCWACAHCAACCACGHRSHCTKRHYWWWQPWQWLHVLTMRRLVWRVHGGPTQVAKTLRAAGCLALYGGSKPMWRRNKRTDWRAVWRPHEIWR